jgi:hypothetical protein
MAPDDQIDPSGIVYRTGHLVGKAVIRAPDYKNRPIQVKAIPVRRQAIVKS